MNLQSVAKGIESIIKFTSVYISWPVSVKPVKKNP